MRKYLPLVGNFCSECGAKLSGERITTAREPGSHWALEKKHEDLLKRTEGRSLNKRAVV